MLSIFNIVLLILLVLAMSFIKSNKREPFDSHRNCVNAGYPLNFCLNVPVQSKTMKIFEAAYLTIL